MIIERIGQGLRFLFGRYSEKNNRVVKTILSNEEFKIFDSMSEYEKIHSFRLFQMILSDETLQGEESYKKLALLHDCGKINASIFRRMKKVFIGDAVLDRHSECSFEKLKNINYKVALLARKHHLKPENKLMKRFQELDEK